MIITVMMARDLRAGQEMRNPILKMATQWEIW